MNKIYGPLSITDASVSNNSEEGIAIAPGADITEPVIFRNVTAVNNAKWGLWLISYLNFTISDVTIDRCIFNGSTDSAFGYGLYLYAAAGSTLSNVTVTNCTMNYNNLGVYFRAGSDTSTLSPVSITSCSIENNNTGISFTENAAAGNSAHGNIVVCNTSAGIQNNDPNHTFDAENNWWGCNSGPGIIGQAGTEVVSDQVDCDPWLVLNLSASPTELPSDGVSTATVTADLTMNSDGIPAGSIVPDGTEIAFASRLHFSGRNYSGSYDQHQRGDRIIFRKLKREQTLFTPN